MLDALLDASVFLSFDRTGYRRHARRFHAEDLQVDLRGVTIVVTGANSGLGLAATRQLARLGATVAMACRDEGRGEAARASVLAEQPGADVAVLRLDLSSLADVRRFVAAWAGRVDVLVNNAGVLPPALTRTAEGHELTFATNVLGPFALTKGLLPRLRDAGGRVVTVSSGGMYPVRLDLRALEGDVRRFDGVKAYAQTKRAEVVLNALWAEREPRVTFAAMHPGWADTPAVRSALPRFHALTRLILRSADEGADTVTWLAARRPAVPSGRFWFDRSEARTHALPRTHERPGDREALWARLEALTAG
ncbi:MAG: SDR family NAD(P)-dependent oxidoreductase [Myxococcota bacterium]|jgi:NAD(P)-dependent dehydrogenase (short-subunit alcohol dehydrogenase family)